MESSQSLFLLIIAQSGFILLLLIIGFSIRNGRFRNASSRIKKAKSRLEQTLVLEAISACAAEQDFTEILKSLGMQAAEKTGYSDWSLWLREEKKYCFKAWSDNNDAIEQEKWSFSHKSKFIKWLQHNAEPLELNQRSINLIPNTIVQEHLLKLSGGVIVPFVDGPNLLGFLSLGNEKLGKEKRSVQFLSLFGAFAAVIIKKSQIDQQEKLLRRKQQRDEYFTAMGKMSAGLAHELRNPLAFIRASTEYLASDEKLDPKRYKLSNTILDQIDRMNQSVEDLLSLGKMDVSKFEALDIIELITNLVNFASEKAKAYDIEFLVELEDGRLEILGDSDKLWQLMLNLVLNSIEAMPDGGNISIRSYEKEEDVIVEVEDSGPGIAAEIVDNIFDPFASHKEKGTGLGLAIGRSIAMAHNATLELAANSQNGACFRLTIPSIQISK